MKHPTSGKRALGAYRRRSDTAVNSEISVRSVTCANDSASATAKNWLAVTPRLLHQLLRARLSRWVSASGTKPVPRSLHGRWAANGMGSGSARGCRSGSSGSAGGW
ncbi:hypothetical protein J7E91_21075 [Streptomyces sp. ISL-99]|nr:hypothetical protein [Streptomyces sp. ISL-99]MBT2527845.1 hypothetical protein [Streptomyces sp. ISL-99]